MNISQRQATIAVLGFQLAAMVVLFLIQMVLSGLAHPLTLGAGVAMLIYGGMLFAYLRGWEYARHISVVLITIVVAVFLPEPFVTQYAPFLILLGPILALVMVDQLWVMGSAVATIGILLLRAGGSGVYANLETILNYAMLIAGLVISRVIVETAHAQSRKAEAQIEYQDRLLSQINDAVIATDDQFHITVWNQGAEKLYGWSAKEALGRNLTDLIRSDMTSAERTERLMQLLHGNSEYHLELAQYHKDGHPVYVEANTVTLYDTVNGRAAGLMSVNRDITERRQAEESRQYLSEIIERSLNEIYVFDSETLKFKHVNLGALTNLQYTLDEIKEMTPLSFKPEFTEASFRAMIQPLLAREQEILIFETIHRRADGSTYPVEVHLQLVGVGNESVFLAAIYDITVRKHAELKLARQNQRLKILREIDTAILAADSVESIVDAALSHIRELINCRRAAMALIDNEMNEIEVFSVRTDVKTSILKGTRLSLTAFQGISETLTENQPVVISDLAELADIPPLFQNLKNEGLRSVCILPLFSQGRLIGAFNMSSEIPGFFDEEKISLGREVANQVAIAINQSRLLEALQHSNVELAEHVVEREGFIAELTAKNAELENFTYTVSHDLKSPLVTIKGFLGYLEQDAASGNLERLKSDTQRIASAVDKMQQLLKDLLELSRLGRFIYPAEVIPFEVLARTAVGLVESQLQTRGLAVQIQPSLPLVYVDRQRLIEVLQNLLDNAVKYIGTQLEPQIEIGQRGEEHGKHIFFVRDNGIGIAPEYHERVFGLFNKLDANSDGTGVGLAFVKRVIELHEGRIWVESEPGQGTTFLFTLPKFE